MNGSTVRLRIVASVWMFTTDGSTLCATTTIGVRRDALTLGGMVGAAAVRTGCEATSGLPQPMPTTNRTRSVRNFFIRR
jgi:hypothetical protein